MRVFVKGYKVNFVDDNNSLVGFDNTDDCCARGGWFISDKADEWLDKTFKEGAMELPGWNFDKDYFKEIGLLKNENDEGGAVQFRLVNGEQEKFLTLYNFQNGYYSRNFTVKVGGEQKRSGKI